MFHWLATLGNLVLFAGVIAFVGALVVVLLSYVWTIVRSLLIIAMNLPAIIGSAWRKRASGT